MYFFILSVINIMLSYFYYTGDPNPVSVNSTSTLKQSDYISLTTGYDFKENFTHDDIEVMEVIDHLEKTFPNKDLREYFIEYCASLLKGGNFNKTFIVMTNLHINIKSLFNYLPITDFVLIPKRRGRKKKCETVDPNKDIISVKGAILLSIFFIKSRI